MSKLTTALALGLFLALNACTVGEVTASSRIQGGNGGTSLGPIREANSPGNVERPLADRPVMQRDEGRVRENPGFRIESDCWRCR